MEEHWRRLYPSIPTGYPEGGGSEASNYLHLTVIYFEYRALIELLGPEEARRVIEEKLECPAYRFIYRTVLRDYGRMSAIMERCGLVL